MASNLLLGSDRDARITAGEGQELADIVEKVRDSRPFRETLA